MNELCEVGIISSSVMILSENQSFDIKRVSRARMVVDVPSRVRAPCISLN